MRYDYSRGFALPTILIASLVMLAVLTTALQTVSVSRVSLDNQYYNSLARQAAEAGVAYANACLSANGGLPTWDDAAPLKPNTDCSGTAVSGQSSYVLENTKLRTVFTVGSPETDGSGQVTNVSASGKIELLRKSTGIPWKSYTQGDVVTLTRPYVEDTLPAATSITGYWTIPPPGYLLEDGSAVSRTLYADLFDVIGTRFGAGDGSTTFNLPDSRGRVAVNKSTDTEFDTIGEKTGVKAHILTSAELPSHAHSGGVTGTINSVWQRVVHQPGGSSTANHYTGWSGGSFTDRTDASYPDADHTHNLTTNSSGGGQGHNNIQPSIVQVAAIKYTQPTSTNSVVPAGSSIQGYWDTAPSGYLIENGSAVSRTTYSSLYSTLGTRFGAGDGSTTFNLPDSRGRVAVNKSTDTEFDVIGEKYGTKTVSLTTSQTPSHSHTGTTGFGNSKFYRLLHVAGGSTSANHSTGYASGPYTDYTDALHAGADHRHNFTINASGGGGAHSNLQPGIVKLSVIKHAAENETLLNEKVAPGTSLGGYWTNVPDGYLLEDGSAVSRTLYADLFDVIGTRFGAGDGSTTFNLPDSRGRVAVNKSTDTEFDTIGEKTGAKTHSLTLAEMPGHTHSGSVGQGNSKYYRLVHQAGTSRSSNHALGRGSGSYTDKTDANYPGASHKHDITTGSEGGNASHNNIMPSIVNLSVIKY